MFFMYLPLSISCIILVFFTGKYIRFINGVGKWKWVSTIIPTRGVGIWTSVPGSAHILRDHLGMVKYGGATVLNTRIIVVSTLPTPIQYIISRVGMILSSKIDPYFLRNQYCTYPPKTHLYTQHRRHYAKIINMNKW